EPSYLSPSILGGIVRQRALLAAALLAVFLVGAARLDLEPGGLYEVGRELRGQSITIADGSRFGPCREHGVVDGDHGPFDRRKVTRLRGDTLVPYLCRQRHQERIPVRHLEPVALGPERARDRQV